MEGKLICNAGHKKLKWPQLMLIVRSGNDYSSNISHS